MSNKLASLWIIDDDPMASFYIKRLAELGELAHIITIYNKAQGAVNYLLQHKNTANHLPDVILLDIYMPELDGWGFLEEFRKIKNLLIKEVAIYIISSSRHPTDVRQAESFTEVKGYFQKPVEMDALKKIMFENESIRD